MQQIRWVRWTAAVGLIALMTSGCSLLKSGEHSQEIDPPQVPDTAQVLAGIQSAMLAGQGPANAQSKSQLQITLYAKDPNGYLAPVTMGAAKTESVAKTALEMMVVGNPAEANLPQGFSSVLPQGTVVKGINILKNQKTAVVDFSKEFAKYDKSDERKIMEAVTWTLTGFPTVEQVQLWIEGKMLKEMPVAKTPINDSLTRAMGINLEQASGVDIGQSTPVTLYFLGESDGSQPYYVPVTRLIQRTEDVASAAMKQLIQGPSEGFKTGLHAAIADNAEVLNVKLSDDKSLVTVNFNDKILGSDQKAPAEALESVILSLTENTGASKVQIMVNGKSQVNGTDNRSYTKPVARPTQINPVKS